VEAMLSFVLVEGVVDRDELGAEVWRENANDCVFGSQQIVLIFAVQLYATSPKACVCFS